MLKYSLNRLTKSKKVFNVFILFKVFNVFYENNPSSFCKYCKFLFMQPFGWDDLWCSTLCKITQIIKYENCLETHCWFCTFSQFASIFLVIIFLQKNYIVTFKSRLHNLKDHLRVQDSFEAVINVYSAWRKVWQHRHLTVNSLHAPHIFIYFSVF